MAYGNWGAFVFCNGVRREDKEDSILFGGMSIKTFADYCHGVMGDGAIRIKCYKNYAPEIFEQNSDGAIREITYLDENADPWEFNVNFEYKGCKFAFESGDICRATMVETDGTSWECLYGYCYGAGWE